MLRMLAVAFALLASSLVAAQGVPTLKSIVTDAVTANGPPLPKAPRVVNPTPTTQATYFEREAAAYIDAATKVKDLNPGPELVAVFESYWQKRLDVADRIDRGQLTPELGYKLMEMYRQQALGTVQAKNQETQQQLLLQLQAIAAQQQAQADARREQQRMQLIEQGLRLMTPQRQAIPTPTVCRWIGPNFVCN